MTSVRLFTLLTIGSLLRFGTMGCSHHRGQSTAETGMFDVKDLKWKKRILVAKLETIESAESAMLRNLLAQRQREVDNRHLVFIQLGEDSESLVDEKRLSETEAQALKTHFQFKDKRRGVWLVGKDGTIKAYYDLPLNLDSVFALIDTMTMRQEEMNFDK